MINIQSYLYNTFLTPSQWQDHQILHSCGLFCKYLQPIYTTGPFVNMQIDFAHIPSCRGYKYLLVITDQYPNWVKCFPTRKEDARTVVKCLLREVIPKFGVSQGIDSDRGPTFVSQLPQGQSAILGFKRQLHVPYHPQS